jgi:tetratricopeptide (TPR) repeat protein
LSQDSANRQAAEGGFIAQASGAGAQASVAVQFNIPPEVLAKLLDELKPKAPLPQISDLFEIVFDDPAEIPGAIFRTSGGTGITPYAVPYLKKRVGVADVQEDLYQSLLDSAGALLVSSRAGLGKSREVAQLAMRFSEQGWLVCVAKGGEADARMNVPAGFPDILAGRRLLFVVDDLHRRVGPNISAEEPYIDRLNAFVGFFDRILLPGEMYLVATSRTEPHHQKQLRFDPSHPSWKRFRPYELAEYDQDGLKAMLLDLAAWAGIDLDRDHAAQMVGNSDWTPRTLVLNVDRARRSGKRLTMGLWLPSQGQSWAVRFREARARWPAIDQVYEALKLIRSSGLPTRLAYVKGLGDSLAGSDTNPAAEGLVDMGLLGLRAQILDAFGDEQLGDSLRDGDHQALDLEKHWQAIIEVVLTAVGWHKEWKADLLALGDSLFSAGDYSNAESLASKAISAYGDPKVYFLRGKTRYAQNRVDEGDADFEEAIRTGASRADIAEIYLVRGGKQWALDNFDQAERYLSSAISYGETREVVYVLRGQARERKGDILAADADYTTAIGKSNNDGALYYFRGTLRARHPSLLKDAVVDLTRALELGYVSKDVYYTRGMVCYFLAELARQGLDITALEPDYNDIDGLSRNASEYLSGFADAEKDLSRAIELGDEGALAYHTRGHVRIVLEKFVEAEADFSAAIERGRDDVSVYLLRARAREAQSKLVDAECDASFAVERDPSGWEPYTVRGRLRYSQGNHTAAERDLTVAIERSKESDAATVYALRGFTRVNLDRYAEAEADFSAAIQLGANCFAGRGLSRMQLGNFSSAEKDLSEAVARGEDGAGIYQARAAARIRLDRLHQARQDCEEATHRAPKDASTYYCWGDFHLALGECDAAIAEYEAAMNADPDRGNYFGLALAFLLCGRIENAQRAYQEGLEKRPKRVEIDDALRELDLWTARQSTRVASAEAQSAIAHLRQELRQACESVAPDAPPSSSAVDPPSGTLRRH